MEGFRFAIVCFVQGSDTDLHWDGVVAGLRDPKAEEKDRHPSQ
jgi:hypothetical protein